MNKVLSEGQFPPRWSGDLMKGYGFPLFLFNYPLPALFGEIFVKLGWNALDSVKAVMVVSVILSALGMYWFLKELLGLKRAAFLGSLFYIYAPIRFLDIYVSAAVGSALALAFIPFIFYSVVRLKRKGEWWPVALGAISLASLVLSHNTTAIMFAPLILVFMVIMLFGAQAKDDFIKKCSVMLVLGIGLSSWFWIPALAEKQYTIYDLVMGNFYQDQFPTLNQLIYSPWGFGFSNPGPNDGISFQVGLIHWLVMLILIAAALLWAKVKEFRLLSVYATTFFIISIFLMLPQSLIFWGKMPLLNYVIYPARFLAVAIFCASIAASLIVKYLPLKTLWFLGLLVLVLYANRNHIKINERTYYPEAYYQSIKSTGTSFAEHTPKWAKEVGIDSSGKLSILGGEGTVKIFENKSVLVNAQVVTEKGLKMRFNQYYFPNWQIKIDGKNIPFSYTFDIQNYGLPVFDVPAGYHQVTVQFTNTFIRDLADKISLVSLTVLTVLLAYQLKNIMLKFR